MEIVKGTTPTFQYTFNAIDPTELTEAYFVIRQGRENIIQMPLSEAEIDGTTVSFTISQEDSLKLIPGLKATILLDWAIGSQRGQGKRREAYIGEEGVDEVI